MHDKIGFVMGSLEDDKIELLDFCMINLITLTEEKCEIPFIFADNHPMPKCSDVKNLIISRF